MPDFAFQQVDVFTSRPLLGNPLAVDCAGRRGGGDLGSILQMQQRMAGGSAVVTAA